METVLFIVIILLIIILFVFIAFINKQLKAITNSFVSLDENIDKILSILEKNTANDTKQIKEVVSKLENQNDAMFKIVDVLQYIDRTINDKLTLKRINKTKKEIKEKL